MSEKQTLNKIRKGDRNALDSFLRDLYPQVYSFTYRKLLGDDIAKDITQETFVRFIRALPMYRSEGKVLHYLYCIASHLCHDHYRKQQREKLDNIDDISTTLHSDENVHEAMITTMRNEELMLYIGELKETQQDIILLKYFHQMTFKEIAQTFHVPESTIKTRHTAALKQLHKLWKEGDYHDIEG